MKQILDKSFKILDFKYKISLVYILVITFLISALDIAGIGLVFPLFSSIISDNYIDNRFYQYISNIYKFQTKNDFLYFLTFSILIVFTLKNILLFFLTWFKDKFVLNLNDSLSMKFFTSYINKDLLFHSNINSAKLITNLDSEVRIFTKGILISLTSMIHETITMLLIFTLLVLTNVEITLFTVLILLFFMLIILFVTKKKLRNLGEVRSKYVIEKLKLKQQSFNSIRDIKINFLEEILSNSYFKIMLRLRQIKIFSNLISLVPKILFETLIIFLICLFFIYSINKKMDLVSYLPLLGLYFLCALRFVPSLSKTINYINVIRFSEPALNKLYNDSKDFKNINYLNKTTELVKFEKKISIEDVNYSFNKGKNIIFKNINFVINKNSITGIIGRTGSGKSSLLNMILGFYKPDSGAIYIDNINIANLKNMRNWYKLVGLVPQDVFIYDNTLLNNIILNNDKSKNFDENLLNVAIKNSELSSFVSSLEDGIYTNLGEKGNKISGGQKQRIGIARCLYKKKEVIILDEATNSLDKHTEKQILNNLKNLKKEKTIVIVSHEPSVIEYCDHIFKIENFDIDQIK